MPTDHRRGRWLFAGLWLALLGSALLFAPTGGPARPVRRSGPGAHHSGRSDRDRCVQSARSPAGGLLGHPPVRDWQANPWPVALSSFILGGFVLLPYLVLRDTRAPLDAAPNRFVRALGSRVTGAIVLLIALALIGFAVVTGDPAVFAAQLQDSALLAVMSVELLVLTVALHRCAAIDRERRGFRLSGWHL